MTRKGNVWKPIIFAPSGGSPQVNGSATQHVAVAPNPRVRTSRDARRAFQSRQAVASTSHGTYVLTHGLASAAESDLGRMDSLGTPSRSGEDTIRSPRSSSPPQETVGWSSDFPPSPQPPSNHRHHQRTRANQWAKWTTVVIPLLVQPYLHLLRRTESLGSIDRQFSSPCICQQAHARSLKVICVHFDGKLTFLCYHSTLTVNSSCPDFFKHLPVHDSPASPVGPRPDGLLPYPSYSCCRCQAA